MPASAVSAPTASTRTPDGRVGRHGAGDDAVADVLGHGTGLAGDHRLVELGLAVDDDAVGRHASAGAHEHDVTDAQLVDPNRLDAARR